MFAGLDLGASHTKCVIVDSIGHMLARAVCRTGANFSQAAEKAFEGALQKTVTGEKGDDACADGLLADSLPVQARSSEVQAGETPALLRARGSEAHGSEAHGSDSSSPPFAKGGAVGDLRGRVSAVCATGYGRTSTSLATTTRTEISCQALGCVRHFPGQALTIVDIGGQDTKIIKVESSGRRTDFKMNRKCAAGTGAFLEEMAYRLEIPLGDFDSLAHGTKTTATIGSFCTVFAATEMIARIRGGESREAIIRGIFVSLVKRVRELDPLGGTVVLTGGVVAHNPVIAELLAAEIGREVLVPPDPQFTGALGAALTAWRSPHDKLCNA